MRGTPASGTPQTLTRVMMPFAFAAVGGGAGETPTGELPPIERARSRPRGRDPGRDVPVRRRRRRGHRASRRVRHGQARDRVRRRWSIHPAGVQGRFRHRRRDPIPNRALRASREWGRCERYLRNPIDVLPGESSRARHGGGHRAVLGRILLPRLDRGLASIGIRIRLAPIGLSERDDPLVSAIPDDADVARAPVERDTGTRSRSRMGTLRRRRGVLREYARRADRHEVRPRTAEGVATRSGQDSR